MLAERVIEWTQQWEKQGLEKGLRQGRREGLQEGEAAMLRQLLELRFGELDETIRARVCRADSEILLQWGRRVLTAASLPDVFKP